MVISKAHPHAADTIIETLSSCEPVILECDTMYGIVGVVPDCEARISAIKSRTGNKPFLQLIADSEWVSRVSDLAVPPELQEFWPGPLTLVFPHRASGTVGLRVPADDWLRRIIRAVGVPLYSTSVNVSGQDPLSSIAEIVDLFSGVVDLIVDSGTLEAAQPSTVLDITRRPFRMLRQGRVRIPCGLIDPSQTGA